MTVSKLPSYYDGTNGDQPRHTTMQGCLCREIGHYEKQSSCWFQAKSARSTVQGNVMFNMVCGLLCL